MKNNESFYNHPIFDPLQLHINTMQIENLRNTLHQWIWTGSTGGYITGESRIGKTTAIEQLANTLHYRDESEIPSLVVTIPNRDKNTIASIYRNLCLSANIPIAKRDVTDDLKRQISLYICDIAISRKSQWFVLFVDEMQRLTNHQFGAFAELYDFLRTLKLNLFVVFVGNELESSNQIKKIKFKSMSHIRGRFFSRSTKFYGISSIEELKYCLNQYDSLRYPDDGPSYTQYFVNSFDPKWKLTELADMIWTEYCKTKTRLKVKSWPMQYFISSTNILLADYIFNFGLDVISPSLIQKCFIASGFDRYEYDVE